MPQNQSSMQPAQATPPPGLSQINNTLNNGQTVLLYNSTELKHAIDEDFESSEQVGKGAFGTVFRCTHKKSGQVLALKMITRDGYALQDPNEGWELDEMVVSRLLPKDDTRIARYRGAFIDDNLTIAALFFDYHNFGNLWSLTKRHKEIGAHMEEAFVWHVALQLCGALEVVHKSKVIHNDIKTGNVLLHWPPGSRTGRYPHVTLADFGVSEQVQEELFYDGKNDYLTKEVFNLGSLIHELVYGKMEHSVCKHGQSIPQVSDLKPRNSQKRTDPASSKEMHAFLSRATRYPESKHDSKIETPTAKKLHAKALPGG